MILTVSEELIHVLDGIVLEDKLEREWADIESDDMFQSDHFTGGFDATEMAFCFSYLDARNDEYWFQLTLDEIREIVNTRRGELELRPAV